MTARNKNIPALRFKGFAGEWHQQRLADFISFISGYAFDSTKMLNEKGNFQIIKMSNVYKSELQLDRSSSFWNEIDSKTEKFLLRKKDIILTLTGTVGKKDYGYSVAIPEDNKYLLNQRLVCLRSISKVSDGDFINNLAKTSHFLYFFYGESKGGTGNQTNVGIEDLRNIKLNIPSLPEQQKIASFLSAIDEKIRQLTRRKELLEQYKKGLMQQLFSGNLRFKDDKGKAYPKWEEKRLGDLGVVVSGLTYSPNDIDPNGVLVLRSSNVQDRRLAYEDNVYVNVKPGDFNPVKENDILICVRNGSKNLIGKNALIHKENAGVAFGAFMAVYRSDFNPYLFHYFDTDNYKNEVHKNLGATINSINGSELRKFIIPFPSKPEQQKIASFLSSIDSKIESVNAQIGKTQMFKKGLLQQMFV